MELSDKMIRLVLIEIVAQMLKPNDARGNLLITVDELYDYVKSGSKPEINVEADDTEQRREPRPGQRM